MRCRPALQSTRARCPIRDPIEKGPHRRQCCARLAASRSLVFSASTFSIMRWRAWCPLAWRRPSNSSFRGRCCEYERSRRRTGSAPRPVSVLRVYSRAMRPADAPVSPRQWRVPRAEISRFTRFDFDEDQRGAVPEAMIRSASASPAKKAGNYAQDDDESPWRAKTGAPGLPRAFPAPATGSTCGGSRPDAAARSKKSKNHFLMARSRHSITFFRCTTCNTGSAPKIAGTAGMYSREIRIQATSTTLK